jgi:MoaA/NifB/PqqE/SkfB family radical SAM enzyme
MVEGTGVVHPCAYRGNYGNTGDHPPLGNLNIQTISEIWNGPEVRELRRNMAAGDLKAAGCTGCLAIAQGSALQLEYDVEADQEKAPYSAYRANLDLKRAEIAAGKDEIVSKPLVLYVTPTHKCNLRCTHCYQASSRSQTIERKALESEIKDLMPYLSDIIPGGGEPLILPFWVNLLTDFDRTVNPYLRLATATSASHVSEAVFRGLSRFKRLQIMVSFDGPDKETFESIRKNAKFETVIANLRRFQEIAEPITENGIVMHISVMKQNIRLLPDLIRLAAALEVPFNLQPVVAYPIDHSLRCMRMGPGEMAGWKEALDETSQLIDSVLLPALIARNARLGHARPDGLLAHLPMHIDAVRSLIPWDAFKGEYGWYYGSIPSTHRPYLDILLRKGRHGIQPNNPVYVAFAAIADAVTAEPHHYGIVNEDGTFSAFLPAGRYVLSLVHREHVAVMGWPWEREIVHGFAMAGPSA